MQSAKNPQVDSNQPPDSLWWSEFFQAGAFLRIGEGQILLWKGPFEVCAESRGSEKDPKISIGYMEFFSSTTEFRLAQLPPLRLALAQVQAGLLEFQKSLNIEPARLIKHSDFENRGYAEFEKNIQSILGKIQRGEIEKAVPVIFSRSQLPAAVENVVSWMSHLLQTPPSLNAFGFWENGVGIVGATPEILFHRKAGKLTTMALAGTMPRSELGKRNSLLKDPKELHEHQVVVEDLQQQLEKWGWVKKSETKILELPTLLHLQTLLEVENVNCGPREIMQRLHPTPALGLAPRAYGYHWLKNTSDQEGRRLFGAPILFSIPSVDKTGTTEELCLVAIRNIQWDTDGCRIGAGCGVVKESQPEQEWQELMQKTNSIFDMLGIKGKQT